MNVFLWNSQIKWLQCQSFTLMPYLHQYDKHSLIAFFNIVSYNKMKFVILIVFPILALCWRDIGHMLTAVIAQTKLNELNPQAGNRFYNLVNSISNLCDNRSRSFVEASCWADDLKQANMTLFDPLHYTNPPYLSDTVGPIINQTSNVVNVIEALKATAKILKMNLQKHTAERALFARFLVHLTGDIHQPLHSSALFNRTFPRSDLGGNLLTVTLNGQAKNFHKFWDYGAYYLQNSSFFLVRPLNQQNKTALHTLAQNMLEKYGCQVEGLAKNIDPLTWSLESFEFAKNTTYPFVLQQSDISEEYRLLTYETSLKRLTLAGLRLANYISDLYTVISPPKTFISSQCSKEPAKGNDSRKKEKSKKKKSSQKRHSRFKQKIRKLGLIEGN